MSKGGSILASVKEECHGSSPRPCLRAFYICLTNFLCIDKVNTSVRIPSVDIRFELAGEVFIWDSVSGDGLLRSAVRSGRRLAQ